MTFKAPIQITLYGPNDEELKTLARTRVPTWILLQAIELSEQLEGFDQAKANAETIKSMFEALGGFVVEVFGQQVSLDEIIKGCELSDLITVIKAVSNRAQGMVAKNPTKRPARTKKPLKRK